MSSIKNPEDGPSLLEKIKKRAIEYKKVIITVIVVGIVLGLVYYFTTRDSGIIDNDGVVGCPICENSSCVAEKAEILTLEGEVVILEGHKERLEGRISTLETELDDTEDALARKTRDFIGSTIGLIFATIITGVGTFFITRSVYGRSSKSTVAATPTTSTGTSP
ncbi:hypothetical protein EhV341 [Emiliania huxleyi virus 86]|uniref:Putative membrane protein n=2 Tax=Emiliania huxleyi virus 86 TaxID=181082 RepID=Q4A2D8_EHV8U|nr:hypothetical protein EhV341 [Emiliania huxleyi virus 86]AHA55958.1 putative membrane protein [Emiliania huxleyi virus 164]UKZ11365.1 hypothetical protein EhVM1_000350 [Emiliania huxleyi virus M1]CAI65768.1 putative membrane protein [Emiliania huxleyi virus 86]